MGEKALEMDLGELFGREGANWLVGRGPRKKNLEGGEEAGRIG